MREMRKTLFTGVRYAGILFVLVLTLASFTGCGGGSSAGKTPLSGTFTDSAVSGLTYQGDTLSGTTDTDGTFKYFIGDTVSFSIGTCALGAATGNDRLSPIDLVAGAVDGTDPTVTNICVLLQTLDQDGDLNNGIRITTAIADIVSRYQIDFNQTTADFAADPNVTGLLDDLNAAGVFTDLDPRDRTLQSAGDAQDHLARSLSERNTVVTTSGSVKGYAANANTWQYLGIPYAQPPIGDLRWRPPQPPEAWEGVRDAIAWGDQAPQNPAYQSINKGGMSEDCLYLHVTAPKGASNLPVMVWFHGGAFTILSNNSVQYNNPTGLTTKGVVVVTVNHRLGPFGYIAHPLLTAESGYNGSGNYGQMDLVAALEWVQDNIAAFGGNPDSVTIFGQSGGGGKTYCLMMSPQAEGLFHKAVCQSGASPTSPASTSAASLAAAEALGTAMFEGMGATTLEEARSLPWTAIIQAELAAGIPRETYRPNCDYYYLPKPYYQNMLDGVPGDVPFMVGVTSGDYPHLRAALPIFVAQLEPFYQSNMFVYDFRRVPPGWEAMGLLSGHGGELPYLFNYKMGLVSNFALGLVLTPAGTIPEIGDLNGNGVAGDTVDIYLSMGWNADDEIVVDTIMTMWTNFAKTGNPSITGFDWPVYTTANDTYVEIDVTPTVNTGISAW